MFFSDQEQGEHYGMITADQKGLNGMTVYINYNNIEQSTAKFETAKCQLKKQNNKKTLFTKIITHFYEKW